MSHGRHVTMLTEGTYPHVHGGVSTWCDQLVRGMPEVDFNVIALTGSGREPVTWELPRNVYRHTSVPLWGLLPDEAAGAPCGARHTAASPRSTKPSCSPCSTPATEDSPRPCANWPSWPAPAGSPRPCAPSPCSAC